MKERKYVFGVLLALALAAFLFSCTEDRNGKDCWTYAVETSDLAERCDMIVSTFYCCGFEWMQSAGEEGPLVSMTKAEAYASCLETYKETGLECVYQCQLQYADCVTWRDCAVACSE